MFGFPPIIRIFMHLRAGRLLNGEKSIEVCSIYFLMLILQEFNPFVIIPFSQTVKMC